MGGDLVRQIEEAIKTGRERQEIAKRNKELEHESRFLKKDLGKNESLKSIAEKP